MKIICIGRNYIDHARELDNPVPDKPVFFLKPDTALLRRNRPFYYPDFSQDIHFECELVVRISKLGKNIQKKFAHTYYREIGIGIDFTARDLQAGAKAKGLPWEIAKAFDNSAPLSMDFLPVSEFKDIHSIAFRLEKNGKTVQEGNSADMIFDIDELIAYISRFFTLKTGDLIFTGTPAGVGPVSIGDQLQAFIADRRMLRCEIK
jgi:2-keto-4-pentenoate hydratase/2-oxohepta-3-ene-1,7-dioic acid hydratase in catechol pathway